MNTVTHDDSAVNPSTPIINDNSPNTPSTAIRAEGVGRSEKPAFNAALEELKGNLELFVSNDKTPCVRVLKPSPGRTWEIESSNFRDYLTDYFYKKAGHIHGDQTVKNAAKILSVEARDCAKRHEVFIRVAHRDNRRYFDVGGPNGKIVEIEAGHVRFTDAKDLPKGLHLAPTTALDFDPDLEAVRADIEHLWDVVNVEVADRPFVVSWLISSFLPTGGLPILLLTGPEGSGKTSTSQALQALIDPSGNRRPPRSTSEFAAIVRNNWLIAFDNLSNLPGWLSDDLAAVSTGATFGGRLLYSNFGEASFTARRPILLNGIPSGLVSRPDLVSRCYTVRLRPLSVRRTAAEIAATLKEIGPRVLGALLRMVAQGLASPSHRATTTRMADAALWADSCGVLRLGEFLKLAESRDQEVRAEVLSDWPFADPIIELTKADPAGFVGTVKGLLDGIREGHPYLMASWPSYKAFGSELDRHAGAFSAVGIRAEKGDKERDGRRWSFTLIA